MNTNKDPFFLRQIIIDNYSNPEQKGLLKIDNQMIVHQASESCVDDLYLELIINKDGIISDARFDGVGCTISISAANILALQAIDKTVISFKKILVNYLMMLEEKDYNENLLDQLIAFINVPKQPNRIRCASISAKGFLKLLNKEEGD